MGNGKMRPASKGILRRVSSYVHGSRGNVAVITAILLVPLIGAIAVATEVSGWLVEHRAEQNAADSAAIAAATQGGNGFTDWQNMGKAVAASYGFPASRATVTVANPSSVSGIAACNNAACYSVTISMSVPIGLASVVGYRGVNGNQNVQALAIANTKTTLAPFCLLALSGGIDGSGVPHSNITCNIFADTNASCSGHDLTSGFSDVLSSKGKNDCGTEQVNGQGSATDPYAGHSSDVAKSSNCNNTYNPEPNEPARNKISGNISTTPQPFCGDVQLSNDVHITGSDVVLQIENGQLDLNGHKLITDSGAGATVVFDGPGGNTYTGGGTPANFFTDNSKGGKGTVDIAAPTDAANPWQGMALFQNSNVGASNILYTGNSPTLNITGVVDAPKMTLVAKGAIGKSTNGFACFTLVVASITVKGTGDLFYVNPQSQCQNAGVQQAQEPAGVIGQLVE